MQTFAASCGRRAPHRMSSKPNMSMAARSRLARRRGEAAAGEMPGGVKVALAIFQTEVLQGRVDVLEAGKAMPKAWMEDATVAVAV